jgi:hypothetical protein
MTWTLLASEFRLKRFKRFSFLRIAAANFGLERFQAKWTPARVKKARQNENLELRFRSEPKLQRPRVSLLIFGSLWRMPRWAI